MENWICDLYLAYYNKVKFFLNFRNKMAAQ